MDNTVNNESRSRRKGRMLIAAVVITVAAALLLSPVFSVSGKAQADSYKYKVKVKAEVLNVRAKASADSKRLGQLQKGKTLKANRVVKDSNGDKWYRFKYKGKTAYIIADQAKRIYMIHTYSKAKRAYVDATVLNVRAKSSVKSKKLGKVTQNKTIYLKSKTITKSGSVWYRFKFNGKNAYLAGTFVKMGSPSKTKVQPAQTGSSSGSSSSTGVTAVSFETYMKRQGFPASYKPYLRKLHKQHPKWVFVAKHAGYSWGTLNARAQRTGANCIDSSDPKSWRSTDSSVYNKKTKKWTTFDGGRWYQAKDSVIAYYLDPRNFLNESSIYQFMGHRFDSASQTTSTISSIVSVNSSCFMNNSTYVKTIYKAGRSAGVNPNVITAMIIEEQGWRGTSNLISGTYPGYKGIYNYFNIGAYTTSKMSAVQRGLWWAKGAGVGATTYGRPWTTRQKAITGGAMFYKSNYINCNQDTYYTKKFNVMNGAYNVATHEYMTNVRGADQEGKLLAYAYRNNSNYPIKFYIPVYQNMPTSACQLP